MRANVILSSKATFVTQRHEILRFPPPGQRSFCRLLPRGRVKSLLSSRIEIGARLEPIASAGLSHLVRAASKLYGLFGRGATPGFAHHILIIH